MLTRLSIRDIVLIDRLDIDFSSGLSVLTGETGAGKSILLDAFALALGARGDASLVRKGAEQGQVTAAFDVAPRHPARALFAANDIPAEDELILRRVQLADGRTRAFVNESPVGVQVLKSLGASLVEIHGQHDDRALLDTAAHRRLLDAFGGLDADAAEVARLWTAVSEADAAVAQHRDAVERARREADFLRHAVDELRKLAPEQGEETALATRRTAMMQVEKVADDLRDAHTAVAGNNSPVAAFSAAVRRLERRKVQAPELIEPAAKALDAALNAIEDARSHLERALARPITIRTSSSASRSGCLRYVPPAANMLCRLTISRRSRRSRPPISNCSMRVPKGSSRWKRPRLPRAAPSMQQRRNFRRSARRSPTNSTSPSMPNSSRSNWSVRNFRRISALADPGPQGIDRIEFWVQTNPGTLPGPMMKVASGGELARFLLALKVVLADRGSAPTLVFDEIDTGVGGAVADAIGVRLAKLANGAQALAVTHAPQVAARATHHYLISKDALDKGKRVATRVMELPADRRREEIARMLAGAEITTEARAAAERLLKAAS